VREPPFRRATAYSDAASRTCSQLSSTILLTHAHFDHLWGISDAKNASLLFPSAEFVASETEVTFWSAPDLVGKLSPAQKPLVTQVNLKLARPRLRLIKAGTEVTPGVTTLDTSGHTPGHMSVRISSGSEEMLLTGDVVVDSAVSFLHPGWPFGFDLDVQKGAKTRMAFLDRQQPTRRWSVATIYPSRALGTWCARGAPTAGCRPIGSGQADELDA
jgi:glyoxylase-like metal-dependent hydrolase (beta-lactamase superfamily II)